MAMPSVKYPLIPSFFSLLSQLCTHLGEEMGSIRVRQGRYQANVRRKGYAPVTKTFTSREVAKRWIKSTEIAIEKGEHSPKISTTVGEMLDKYKLICLAAHMEEQPIFQITGS